MLMLDGRVVLGVVVAALRGDTCRLVMVVEDHGRLGSRSDFVLHRVQPHQHTVLVNLHQGAIVRVDGLRVAKKLAALVNSLTCVDELATCLQLPIV